MRFRRLRRNQSVLERQEHQLCIGLDIEGFHDLVFVEHDGFLADSQNVRDLFHWPPFPPVTAGPLAGAGLVLYGIVSPVTPARASFQV